MLKERGFTADQIEETVRNPSWTKKDDARVQKEMGQSRERGSAQYKVITAYYDRRKK